MSDRDKAIQLIRMKGPVVPANISKDLGKNLLFTSVILSDLVSSKLLRMSSLRIGSSPLYYLPGQEQKLELFYKHLNEKDRRTFDLLREKRILRERDQDPLVRVSLSQIKDFAVPLEVTINGEKEIFWKWHTLQNEEAKPIIARILEGPKPPITEEMVREEKVAEPKKTVEAKKEEQPAEEEPPALPAAAESDPAPLLKPRPARRPDTQRTLEEPDDPFYLKVKRFLDENGASVIGAEVTRKGKDIDLEIAIRTKLGDLTYFCRAKDKKRVMDPDIASAYIAAQMRKLPLLFLATGELSKKAADMMDKDFFGVTFRQM